MPLLSSFTSLCVFLILDNKNHKSWESKVRTVASLAGAISTGALRMCFLHLGNSLPLTFPKALNNSSSVFSISDPFIKSSISTQSFTYLELKEILLNEATNAHPVYNRRAGEWGFYGDIQCQSSSYVNCLLCKGAK